MVSANVSVSKPGPSHSNGSISTARPSLWRRALRGSRRSSPFADNPQRKGSPAVPQDNETTSKPLPLIPCEPEVPETPGPSKSTPASDMISSEPKAERPTWSVEYHPKAKRVLDLHLANVITYEAPVRCVKVSPDGHRAAIGLGDGITYLTELKTESNSNIWLVSDSFFQKRFGLT